MPRAKFIVIDPITLTESMLTSHSVAESESTYNPATTYAADDVVLYDATTLGHDSFRSLQGSNTGNTPVKWPETSVWWYDLGKTNRWQMFDLTTNAQTTGASPMTFTLEPGQPVTAIGLDRVEGDTVRIQIAGTSYDRTIKTNVRDVTGFYTFYTAKHRYRRAITAFDLPGLVENPVITVTITNSEGDAKCGGVVIGQAVELGSGQGGSTLRINSYSLFERDSIETNRVRLQDRGSFREANVQAFVRQGKLNLLSNLLTELDSTPTFWAGTHEIDHAWYETFIIRGVIKSPIEIPSRKDTKDTFINLSIQGI